MRYLMLISLFLVSCGMSKEEKIQYKSDISNIEIYYNEIVEYRDSIQYDPKLYLDKQKDLEYKIQNYLLPKVDDNKELKSRLLDLLKYEIEYSELLINNPEIDTNDIDYKSNKVMRFDVYDNIVKSSIKEAKLIVDIQ